MLREFDALYAVSDLHLGGPPNQRPFRETQALTWLIHHVAAQPNASTALLLNGDIVDFLADARNAREFNPAADKILLGMKDDADFKPIFDALAAMLTKPGRHLVVQLGNHDIELALPHVQAAFRSLIGATSSEVAERVSFETSVHGWNCKIGPRLVLAVHGNAADPWNAVDQRWLDDARKALAGGPRLVHEPQPNAGTTLVVHVMNAVKAKFPFVDLLKPEDAPLMAVLEAVNADASARGLFKALGRRVTKGHWRELLGDGDTPAWQPGSAVQAQMADFLESIPVPRADPQDALLRAERHLQARSSVRSLVEDDRDHLGSVLDHGRVKLQQLEGALGRLRGEPELGALRRAMVRWLADDRSFDIHSLSAIDLRIIETAPGGVDVVIAGHTHLAREQFGDPAYINTGTWMRVLSLAGSRYLRDDAAFTPFFDAVQKGDLASLDGLGIDLRHRPVAVVTRESAVLRGVQDSGATFALKELG